MNANRLRTITLLSILLALAAGVVGYRLVNIDGRPSTSTISMPVWTPPTIMPTVSTSTTTDTQRAQAVAPAAPSVPATSVPPHVAPQSPRPTFPSARRAPPQPAAASGDFGCQVALAYLAAHQAPGFVDVCRPHAASGGYGYTCVNHWPQCAGSKVIAIACPAPVVYQNEASNSWVLTGRSRAPIDPYGQNDRRCPPYA